MARDMFGDVVEPSVRVGSKQGYTVTVSIIVHLVLFITLIVVPLMAYDILPTPPNMINAFVAEPVQRSHWLSCLTQIRRASGCRCVNASLHPRSACGVCGGTGVENRAAVNVGT